MLCRRGKFSCDIPLYYSIIHVPTIHHVFLNADSLTSENIILLIMQWTRLLGKVMQTTDGVELAKCDPILSSHYLQCRLLLLTNVIGTSM